jgi:uncharacterized protein with ParB-like and HNH nuclease domain/predicted transport protein
MKAAEAPLLSFMQKSGQLQIPIYQRTYSWEEDEWDQLWSDLIGTISGSRPSHFIGSIVYIQAGSFQVMGVNPVEVIDGQQRLTTVSLLILALARALQDGPDDEARAAKRLIRDYVLLDAEESEGVPARYKLSLTRGDREAYNRLVDGYEPEPSSAPRLVAAYKLFTERVQRSSLPAMQLLSGLERLLIVDISLDPRYDNPQLIFESVNATGRELSQGDLIRNYILMGQPPKLQEEIYNRSWYPLERLFPADDPELFDYFVRDYLTTKTGQIPKIDLVYDRFKSFARAIGLSKAELAADLHHRAVQWIQLAFARTEDPALHEAVTELNQLRVDVVYPFLLEVMQDCEDGVMSKSQLVQVVRLIENYVFRRALAGIPTNVLNKTFAALASEIDKQSYLESLQAALLLKESYARMPRDEEIRTALAAKDVYNFRNRNYLLRRLENFGRKELVDVDRYTIEHVLPQNPDLSPEWQDELGPNWRAVQQRYLHTIGNLTLTGYNSELSDHPFNDKLNHEGGFRHSPLWLNTDLGRLQHWNEAEIRARAERLIDRALEIWSAPRLSEDALAKYRKARVTGAWSLSDHAALSGLSRPLFDEIRRRTLNLDAGVQEHVRKQYIAYASTSNFLEVVPLASELKLYLDIPFAELQDPGHVARDVTGVGHWGTGTVELRVDALDQIDEVMDRIRQSFARQGEEGYEPPRWSEAAVQRVIEGAPDPQVQAALRAVVDAGVRNGLYPRPWKISLMFAPPANKTRGLFTLTIAGDHGVELWCTPDAFQTFYGIAPAEVERLLAPAGAARLLRVEEVMALVDQLDALMTRQPIATLPGASTGAGGTGPAS